MRRAIRLLLRWPLGIALITWRYLWSTTPLHRTEELGDDTDLPPPLPTDTIDPRTLAADAGMGPLFHRIYTVRITGTTMSAAELIELIGHDFNRATPTPVAFFVKQRGDRHHLRTGDEFIVRMPGPWDGPVRLIHHSAGSLRLATLHGHLEAGQIEFRAWPEFDGLIFRIESWARASGLLAHVLYSYLRVAKESQLNMWTTCCLRVPKLTGGRVENGIEIRTRRVYERSTIVLPRQRSTKASRTTPRRRDVIGSRAQALIRRRNRNTV